MKLYFQQERSNLPLERYKYSVEQAMLSLFPGEKPVYVSGPISETDSGPWAELVMNQEGDRLHVQVGLCVQGNSAVQSLGESLSGTEFEREGQRRRAVVRCFFLITQHVTGAAPPWGMLTGVRPVKLPTRALRRGLPPKEAQGELECLYQVAPERAKLAVDCAQASLAVDREVREDQVSLYIGIPFCPTRCAYCSFVSADVGRTLKLVEPYLEAVLEELAYTGRILKESGLSIHSLYVGGGTPTTLSAGQLERLFSAARAHLPLETCVEYTVEAGRPDTITREKLEVLRDQGVERISINPQTLEDEVLAAIGRKHSAQDILDAYALAREVGFDSINMDLIAGLPRDSFEGFRRSLEGVLSLKPENITVHTLALKKGSRLMEEGGALPSGEETARMLDFSRDTLREAGYLPYYLYRQKYMSGSLENVGWCLPGKESVYNIIMMEELQTVVSIGGGGVTKLVDRKNGRIVRLPNPKYPHDYLASRDKILAQKDEIAAFYRDRT